jgi:lysophospholipase L1-like esterase
LAVDVLPDVASGDDIGVMFRYSDNNNYYRLSLNLLNGFARLEERLNGTFLTLASDHRGYRPGQPHSIVVEVEGPLIQVFVNDDPLFAASNPDHPAGGIALYSRDVSVFDNVQITENRTEPEIVIARPTAHNVLPGAPLDLDVAAIVRNSPVENGSVRFQYHSGASPVLCGESLEGPPGVFVAQCSGLAEGDYTVEALLLNNGAEIDRDSNQSVAVGSILSASHRYDAIGDSITRGVGDRYSSDTLNLLDQRTISSSGWPALLGDMLTTATGSPNLVGNEGLSGDRADDALTLRLATIVERNPESDRALLLLGTNDSNDFNTTPTTELVSTLQAIIDELHANGRDTVHIALLPPAWGRITSEVYEDPLSPSATRNQTIIDYNNAIRSLVPQPGVQLGPDFFSCFLTPTVNRFSLFEDSLHPNALGYAFMAALWRDAIMAGPIDPPVDPCLPAIYVLGSLDPYAHGHKQTLLEKGDEYYTDESFVLTNVPAELEAGIWVLQRNSDNLNADPDFLSFDAGSQPVSVYIAFDPAGSPPTSSTHSFTPVTLSEPLAVSDLSVGELDVMLAANVTGTVVIGGNKSGLAPAAQQGYVVIVVK